MRILSVDPGKSAGWCLRTEDGSRQHGSCDGSSVSTILNFMTSTMDARYEMFLEEQTPNRISGWKARNTLIRRAEIWAIIAELMGVLVHRVSPSTWQSYLKLRGNHDQRMSGLRALLKAQGYDVDTMTEDECCACGIDLWAAGHRRES